MSDFDLERNYRGDGQPHTDPLPDAHKLNEIYVAPTDLRDAVNMAIFLRRPLLLEGEPGTGKTRLAYSVAHDLGYPLKEVYIRSTSKARDLLYTYDSVRRLYDIQERAVNSSSAYEDPLPRSESSEIDNWRYVRLGPLGEAIELAHKGNRPSVVLIDEIDKADIDFPNDLLLELDRLQFNVDEVASLEKNQLKSQWHFDALQGETREARRNVLPIILITSNREKELPAPFLRRCLFYFLPFPQKSELHNIVQAHFQQDITPLFTAALDKFWQIRERTDIKWRKPPSTSALLDWIRILNLSESRGKIDAVSLQALHLSQLPHIEALLKTTSDRESLLALSK